jgi:DNA-binding winged helix-turn-helix (wHTH) protein/tetratricopeptide (TPR) repeat protein
MFRFAEFGVDLSRAELHRPDGEVIHLRPKSLALLHYLAQNAGRIASKQELMQAVWPDVHVGEDSLFQCIRDIRSALGDERRHLIKVLSGRGYMLDAPVSFVAAVTDIAAIPNASVDGGPSAAHDADPTRKLAEADPIRRFRFTIGPSTAIVAASVVACAIGLVAAAPFIGSRVFVARPPIIAVAPIVAMSADPDAVNMAREVTRALGDGLSGIPTIRVLAPQAQSDVKAVSGSSVRPDLVLRSELEKSDGWWRLQARIIDASNDEVRWTTAYSVDATNGDVGLQQSRLAAGIGYPLASRISAMIRSGLREGNANIVVNQAKAFINRTTRERFDKAQAMLDKALAADPNNVDLQAALAAQLLRGIQTNWYRGAESSEAQHRAQDLLERASRADPNYIPVIEGYCRFLTATNRFLDSLVACAKVMQLDPWDGLVLFQIGMSQLQLGRFDDALAAFLKADQFNAPQVSRWTWLLGAGLTYVMMDRSEKAVPWLQRSLAITPGTGRTDFVLAAAYERLGRHSEAKAAIEAGMTLRPGSNFGNVALPSLNASPAFLNRSEQVKALMVAAGLPEK